MKLMAISPACNQPHRSTRLKELNFRTKLRVTAVLLASVVALSAQQTPKQTPLVPKQQPAPPQQPGQATHALEAADLESFLDGMMPLTLERDDIPGAVISVVKDGKVLFAKGYGYADLKAKKPVSPTDTLFRPGSISKLFTWTAVMQQVEQGKIDLDRDINDYLDFKVPATFDKPITMRNIMTHTSGFSETVKDMFVDEPKDLTNLRSYLVDHMPKRIFPPGTTPAYSNYATSLAGYIVQRVSGQPLEQYLQQHILQPLAMEHSSFAQPLPPNLKDLMSQGYKSGSEKSGPGKFEVIAPWPAGSASVSAMDMTHFMIAHLQNGQYNGAQILKSATAEMMHSRQALPAGDALNAMCLGFYEEAQNGQRIIGHGGDTVYFHSDLHLIPAANLGFFVSYNSPGKGTFSERTALWKKFLDRYFPYNKETPAAIQSAAEDAKPLSGDYMVSRRIQGNFMNMFGLVEEAKVVPSADGTISVDELKGFNGQAMKFREIAPKVFQRVDGQEKLAFYNGYDGRTTFGIEYPFMVFQKATFFESKGFNYTVLFASLAILLLNVVLWPIAAGVRRHYGTRLTLSSQEKRLRLWTRLVCVADLIVCIGFVSIISSLDNPAAFNDSLDKWIHLLQILGVIGVIGTIVAVYQAVRVWTAGALEISARAASATGSAEAGRVVATSTTPSRRITGWYRLTTTAVALGCLGFAWILLYWGVLNFNLNY
jgi:CubicO group peptidase (beta-lactamase class C family)